MAADRLVRGVAVGAALTLAAEMSLLAWTLVSGVSWSADGESCEGALALTRSDDVVCVTPRDAELPRSWRLIDS